MADAVDDSTINIVVVIIIIISIIIMTMKKGTASNLSTAVDRLGELVPKILRFLWRKDICVV